MLVGFMGTKGSGKDTCADYLVKKYGFVKKSFADPLKRACQELFMFSDDQVFGTQEQKETPDPRWFDCTPRLALQYVGTDLFRDHLDNIMHGLKKDVFIHRFKLWYNEEKLKNPNLKVVIADVRFKNEIELLQNLGGLVIKLNRGSEVVSSDLHPSEMELQTITSYNHLIENNKSKEELFNQLNNYLVLVYHLEPGTTSVSNPLLSNYDFENASNDRELLDQLKSYFKLKHQYEVVNEVDSKSFDYIINNSDAGELFKQLSHYFRKH